MIDYHIESHMRGYIICAKYTSTSQWMHMGKSGEWGVIDRQTDFFGDYAEAFKKMEELMKDEKPKYESRVTAVAVNKPFEPIFSETATKIEIDDEAAGEYLNVIQYNGCIKITPEEWPEIRSQIDKMILQCREVKQ
jgi:hypothetical protein